MGGTHSHRDSSTFDPLAHPDFLDRLTDAALDREGRQERREVRFRCPAGTHEDTHPSARWNPEKAAWTCDACKAGGGSLDLADLLGVEKPIDGFQSAPAPRITVGGHGAGQRPQHGPVGRVDTVYPYHDADGVERWRVTRHETANGKEIRPRHLDGRGKWVIGKGDVDWPPYRLPDLLAADPAETIYIGEGEKVVDALRGVGLVATTNDGGADKWAAGHAAWLEGRHVVILPDNDEPGRRHAEVVAASLVGIAASTKVVALSGLPPKGDAYDWLGAGGTVAELRRLAEVAPPWSPAEASNGSVGTPFITMPTPRYEPRWPILDEAALHGLLGEIVRAFDPHTEADPVATLATSLVMFGNCVGRSPHMMVGDDRHGANLFTVFVGDTAKARKGSSQAGPRRVFSMADPAWESERVQGGLSSGEGLVWAIRDPIRRTNRKGEEEVVDEGIEDKRLLCIEEEYSAVLKAGTRQGNTISEQLRRGWDSRDSLRIMTKNSPASATHPHISLIGHVTGAELKRTLSDTEQVNGGANRNAFICVRRSKALPFITRLPDRDAAALATKLRTALAHGRKSSEVHLDPAAREIWARVYPSLSDPKPGLVGALVARGEAITLRVALIYALCDNTPSIRAEHLLAALAFWQYAEDSARFVFGDATGDPVADRILAALRQTGPLSQDGLRELFNKHERSERIGQAMEVLVRAGLVDMARQETKGRTVTIWTAR